MPTPATRPNALDRDALVQECAEELVRAFAEYNAEFRKITRRAPQNFESCNWKRSLSDAVERIELYGRYVNVTVERMRKRLGEEVTERIIWSSIKRQFAALIEHLHDQEFDKTFFNSVTRRTFATVGVDPAVEFVALDLDPLASVRTRIDTLSYVNRGSLELLFEEVLTDLRFRTPYVDLEHSIRVLAEEVRAHCKSIGERREIEQLELIRPLFYQVTRAYAIGRLSGRGWMQPFIVAFKNTDRGVFIDAVIMDQAAASVLFSFTRSYFHADLDHVGEAVVFLKTILPLKPISELYTVLGRAKQGKTERYRELFHHLACSEDAFVHAPGDRGLVMICFTLPSFGVVFKVIRDRFAYPKDTMRQEVLAKYELVFKHDRAGRLIDAQEFKRLKFPIARFAPELIEELRSEATSSVHIDTQANELVIDHLYIERRMTPLNLFIRSAPADEAERAALDYGQAIRDLAVTNIFPGDLLLKNFGVTRHGRVIFYDYDELCHVTDIRFRDLPKPRFEEDEMRGEAWFYVGENDVFPETFLQFLSFDDRTRAAFLSAHSEILTADWWRQIQRRLQEGEMLEALPYHRHRMRVFSSG